MTARALISGRIWRDPERKVSSAGKPFVSASVRVGNGDAAVWWKVLAFNEAAIEELLALRDGDAISASGEFRAEIFDGRDGPRVGFTLFADRVISAKRPKRERPQESKAEPATATQAAQPFDDGVGL
jgi:hypothetical protein